jgi:hypothetical protein
MESTKTERTLASTQCFFTFTNNASVSKAPGLEAHEGRGRRVFDWEDQFEVDQRFHGSLTINRLFFSPGRTKLGN